MQPGRDLGEDGHVLHAWLRDLPDQDVVDVCRRDTPRSHGQDRAAGLTLKVERPSETGAAGAIRFVTDGLCAVREERGYFAFRQPAARAFSRR